MNIDSKLYLHDSDKAAMAALQAIPGFSQVMKAFMKVWNEQQFKIINMSTNLKLGPNQMSKYYNMLPPICEKIGIDVPELYVKLDVYPNAYTYGDTNPFIVMTSGLFETVPDELIPTVLAHECGHIACHHTLYTTMGQAILNGASAFVSGIGNIALYPIQLAFAYWMRCSEFSADRVAAIYEEKSDRIVEMCMRFAGYDKDIMADANVDVFMEQAIEYRKLVNDSAWNKTLEFITFKDMSHPIGAVRALESKEWEKSERFSLIMECLNNPSADAESRLPVEITPKKFIGKNVDEVRSELLNKGFMNVGTDRNIETDNKIKNGTVFSVAINGDNNCANDFYKKDVSIILSYFDSKTDDEIAMEHPGEIKIPESSRMYLGKNYLEIKKQLENFGFSKIETKEMAKSKLGWGEKIDTVAKIIIDGKTIFEKDEWFSSDAEIIIYYYVSV